MSYGYAWHHHHHDRRPHYWLTRAPTPTPVARSIWDSGASVWDQGQSRWDQEALAVPALPVTVADAVQHLRLAPGSEQGPEAPLLERMIRAAISHLERHCTNAVTRQEWIMRMFVLPHIVTIPIAPLIEIIEIKVGSDVLDPANYVVEIDDRLPGTVFTMHWGGLLPTDVRIQFACGYESPDLVPEAIKQALLMAVASWWENRESLQQFMLTPMVEIGWQDLLTPYRQVGMA